MESTAPAPTPPPSPTLLRRLIHLDTTLSLHLYTLTHPILPYSILKLLELSGDGRFFFPLTLSLLLYPLSTANLSPFLYSLLLGLLLDLVIIGLIKYLVRRPRPVYNKHMFLSFSVDHWSFPSGHSSRVFFVSTFVLLNEELSGICDGKLVNWGVGTWAVLTSMSRVCLGRHFVMDVVVGACLGVAEGLFVVRVFNYENLRSVFWS